MPLVIDVSVVAVWHFKDEESGIADAALARLEHDEALVPMIWWFELRQVLLKGERRRRMRVEHTDQFLAFVQELPIKIVEIPDSAAVTGLARRHQLSIYDAAYLELAQRERIELATLDKALVRAAAAERIGLVGA